MTFLFHFRLFKSNSYLIKIFNDFKQITTEDEMRANEALEKHATFVMATLDETISNIDNYDFVKDLSSRTGGSHQRFSDFQKENFKVSLTMDVALNIPV